jgi:thiamine transport system ATP-binding protein
VTGVGERLVVEGLSVTLGGQRVLDDVSLEAPAGRTTAVLGSSGCGKTTLLRVVCGVERAPGGAVRGRVVVGDADLTDVPPHRRRMGLAFQDRALFPHLDVGGNVAFGLRMAGVSAERTRGRVAEVLELVGLAGYQRRSVATLSGGEAQRVALARALAPDPDVLCLDEPLGSLDRALHDRLVDDLRHLFATLSTTVLLVTHDHTEALALADHLVVLGVPEEPERPSSERGSQVLAAGMPQDVWWRPPSRAVARFLGHQVLDAPAAMALGVPPAVVGDAPWVAIPAGAIRFTSGGEPGAVQGVVGDVQFGGAVTVVDVAVPGAGTVRAEMAGPMGSAGRVGARVAVVVDAAAVSTLRS